MRCLLVFVALLSAVPAAGGSGAGSPALPRPGEEAWSVALHVHGSFSEGDGSMEWQTEMARQWGVDALWWTDHDWRLANWFHTRGFDFETATYDEATARITAPDEAFPGETKSWVRVEGAALGTFALAESLAYEGDRSLRLSAWDQWNSTEFRSISLLQESSRTQNRYALASRVRLGFAIYPETLDPAHDKFVLEVRLSLHPEGQPVLRYVAGSLDGEDADVIPLPFANGTWNAFEVDITQDAIQRFTSGGADTLRAEDNSLYEVRIGLQTRHGGEVVVFFDDYRIEWDTALSGDDLLDKQRSLASAYEQMVTDVRQFVGLEISLHKPQPHINAYGPNLRLLNYDGHPPDGGLLWAVNEVHAQGGIVSFNHVFGPWVYPNPSETPEQKAERVLVRTQGVLRSRALGCDLFEAGYRWRGGASLDDHLKVWDVLTANAVFTTGDGANDTHGTEPFDGWGPWQPSFAHENNFVTWVWSVALTEAALVRSLGGGRAYFGDPDAFAGTIDLATGEGFPMGRVVLTDHDEHELHVRIEGLPAGGQVRLLQMEIREDPPVEYLDPVVLRDEPLGGAIAGDVFLAQVTLDTALASFARVEVHDPAGLPLAFSNPVHFVRDVPARGISAPRVAAILGDLAITEATDFELTNATLTQASRRLTLSGNSPPGLGSLEIRTGARLAPPYVRGAADWWWEDGVLSLIGFDGAGCTVDVSWVSEGLAPVTVHAVALGAGRPNPSGGGTATTFTLPRRTHARLTVIDVTGKLVRSLVDETCDAGEHEGTWDGRDTAGRPVASGVYFLRLDVADEVVTRKTVVLR